MFTVLPHVMQTANRNLAESALPTATIVEESAHPTFAERVSRALHRH